MSNFEKARASIQAALRSTDDALKELQSASAPEVTPEILAERARAANEKVALTLKHLAEALASSPQQEADLQIRRQDKIVDAIKQSTLTPRERRVLEELCEMTAQPVSKLRQVVGGEPVVLIGDLERVPVPALASPYIRKSGAPTAARIAMWAARHGIAMPAEIPPGVRL